MGSTVSSKVLTVTINEAIDLAVAEGIFCCAVVARSRLSKRDEKGATDGRLPFVLGSIGGGVGMVQVAGLPAWKELD